MRKQNGSVVSCPSNFSTNHSLHCRPKWIVRVRTVHNTARPCNDALLHGQLEACASTTPQLTIILSKQFLAFCLVGLPDSLTTITRGPSHPNSMLRNLEIFLPSAKSIGKTAHRFLSETLSSQPHTEAKANYAKAFPALETSNARSFIHIFGRLWAKLELREDAALGLSLMSSPHRLLERVLGMYDS